MRLVPSPVRPGWQDKVTACGVPYHHTLGPDGVARPYWDESRRYEFSPEEAAELYRAAEDCQKMLLDSLDLVLAHGTDADVARYGVPTLLVPAARRSWAEEWPLVTSRMDFSYDGSGPAKLLEWNSDTAMMGVETALALPDWRSDVAPGADQANSLHTAAVDLFAGMRAYLQAPLWFLTVREDDPEGEALLNLTWLRSAAAAAGVETRQAFLEDLTFTGHRFTHRGEPVHAAFKQYNYRYMAGTRAEANLATTLSGDDPAFWLNAPYAAALGAKGLLALAWRLYEGHPNLLATYAGTPGPLTGYARKPLSSHDSMGVSLHRYGQLLAGQAEPGPDEEFVFQELAPLPDLGGGHAVVSVWLAGTRAVGLTVRDTDGLLTYGDQCRFVPHLIADAA